MPDDNTLWDRGTDFLDLVTLKGPSSYLLGLLLLGAAGLLLTIRATRAANWLVLYVGAVLFVTATVADLAKPPFGRLRPFQALAETGGIDTWFAGADSFPSGHSGFYAGLFFDDSALPAPDALMGDRAPRSSSWPGSWTTSIV